MQVRAMSTVSYANLSGVVPVDKSAGMTSHDVVAMVRRAFRPDKIKAGHAGTLDPDATGLLLVCLGSATRLADLLSDRGKAYRASFVLGAATSTEDSSGTVTLECDASSIRKEDVLRAFGTLTGTIQQVPPMVSALHHEGQRLYDLARQGLQVERAARPVTIERIDLIRFTPGARATGEFEVTCGKGVYVRTLCADLGTGLGVGGHMSSLRRLRIGVFTLDGALPSSELMPAAILGRLVSSSEAVSFLPVRRISDFERSEIHFGRAIPAADISELPADGEWIRVVDERDELVALALLDRDTGRLNPKKVLS